MPSFELFYNPGNGDTGGSVVATIQKSGTSSGLGDVWNFTTGAWGTFAATAAADRRQTVPERSPGEAIGYYDVIDFDTDYTGNLTVAYFDGSLTVDTKHPLFSEVRYVRRGVEFDFVVAEDRTNQDISRVFIFDISKRTDGTYAATGSKTISDSCDFDFSWNLPKIVPSNVHVVQIQNITVTPTGSLVIDKRGPQGAYPILSLGGGQVVGVDYTVTCVAVMNTGDQFKCKGVFNCVS